MIDIPKITDEHVQRLGSEELKEQGAYIVPIPYELCDALFFFYLGSIDMYDITQAGGRVSLTSGSCVYRIVMTSKVNPQKLYLGLIGLRRTFDNQTCCQFGPNYAEFFDLSTLKSVFGTFWEFCVRGREEETRMPQIDAMLSLHGKTLAEQIAERHAYTPPDRTEPRKGDSIETWLDWRALKRKRKQRLTLEEIATMSGHSISTLKKHSAQRKPRGTKGTKGT